MKSRIPIPTSFPLSLVVVGSLLLVTFLSGAQPLPEPSIPEISCQDEESCFQNAVFFLESNPGKSELQLLRFQTIHDKFPDSVWGKRAGLRLGLILAEDHHADALKFLEKAARGIPLLRDYIELHQARLLGNLGKHLEAAELLEMLMTSEPSLTFQNDILYQAGYARYLAQQCRPALSLLRQAHAGDPEHPQASQALYAIAECADRLRLPGESEEALREIWWRYPHSPEAEILKDVRAREHLSWMHWNKTPDLHYQRAISFMKMAQFEQAISDLQVFLKSQPPSPRLEQGQFKLAMAYVRLKRYPLAEQIFRTLANGSSPWQGKATVWLARVYLRQGKGVALLDLRNSLPSSLTPGNRSQISWMCGIWFEDHEAYAESMQWYEQASKDGGSHKTKAESLWRLGWLPYRQGHYDKALTAFQDMEDRVNHPGRNQQAQYWHAMTFSRLGRVEEAQHGFRRLAEAYPLAYYGLLARQNLQGDPTFGRPMDNNIPTELLPAGERENHTDQTENLGEEMSYLKSVHFQRSQEFRQLGLMAEASLELMEAVKEFRRDPESLSDLAIYLMQARAYDSGLDVVRRYFGAQIEQGQLAKSSLLLKVAYPSGYLVNIRSYADPLVDPYLVAGIIREESLYDPKALSPVGARGLMQLMPKTASRLAKQLGIPRLDSGDLFHGDMNIRLGVHYVGELLKKYGGNPAFAVAAYNAGPHKVDRWIANFGNRDPDEFVELISYRETRGYVKRVLTSYRAYQYLNPTICSVSPLDMSC